MLLLLLPPTQEWKSFADARTNYGLSPELFFNSANVRLPQVRQSGVRRVPAPTEALSLLPVPPEAALGTAASHLEQEEQVGREAGPASAGEGHGERGARGGAQFCPQPR